MLVYFWYLGNFYITHDICKVVRVIQFEFLDLKWNFIGFFLALSFCGLFLNFYKIELLKNSLCSNIQRVLKSNFLKKSSYTYIISLLPNVTCEILLRTQKASAHQDWMFVQSINIMQDAEIQRVYIHGYFMNICSTRVSGRVTLIWSKPTTSYQEQLRNNLRNKCE